MFGYGLFINALITFLSVAAAVFFFVVKPMEKLMAWTQKPAEEAESDEERRHRELLAAIRESAR